MQSLTVFKSPRWWEAKNRYVYDNKTHRRMDFDTWNKFVDFLEKLSERPLEGKQDAELISPAVFKTDTTRKNDNVLNWAGWLLLMLMIMSSREILQILSKILLVSQIM